MLQAIFQFGLGCRGVLLGDECVCKKPGMALFSKLVEQVMSMTLVFLKRSKANKQNTLFGSVIVFMCVVCWGQGAEIPNQ